MTETRWWWCLDYQGHPLSVIIRDVYLVGMETHGRALSDFEHFQFSSESWYGSEERSTKLVVTQNRTE